MAEQDISLSNFSNVSANATTHGDKSGSSSRSRNEECIREDVLYPSTALLNMYKTWKDDLYCDITLKCGSKAVKAHKIILASVSDYFKNIFKYRSVQCATEIEEYALDKNVFKENYLECIVEFAYTGKVRIDGEIVQDLLVAASFLQIEFIQTQCENFMAKNIDMDNLIQLVPFAIQFNLMHLLNSICIFISKYFYKLKQNGAFWELSVGDFKMLLKNVNFNVLDHNVPVENPELEILKLVGMYLSIISVQERDFRNTVVSELVQEVHFEEISNTDDVISTVDVFPILDCKEVHDIINASPEEKSKCEHTPRNFSNSCKKLCNKNYFFSDNVFEECKQDRKDDTYINDRPVKFIMWIRRWQGESILGGISVKYKSGKMVKHGEKPIDDSLFISEHMFILEENEVITKVTVNSEMMIHSLEFVTNFDRKCGPYGRPKGKERSQYFNEITGYVHNLDAKVVLTQGSLGIQFLRFNWVVFCKGDPEFYGNDYDYGDSIYDGDFDELESLDGSW